MKKIILVLLAIAVTAVGTAALTNNWDKIFNPPPAQEQVQEPTEDGEDTRDVELDYGNDVPSDESNVSNPTEDENTNQDQTDNETETPDVGGEE